MYIKIQVIIACFHAEYQPYFKKSTVFCRVFTALSGKQPGPGAELCASQSLYGQKFSPSAEISL